MKRIFFIGAMCLTCSVFAACSDDDSGGNNDTDAAIQQDTGGLRDAGNQDDDAQAMDASGGTWSCPQIGDCAQNCNGDLDCIDQCKEKGCDTAQNAFNVVMTCVSTNCSDQCFGSGSAQDCDSCIESLCAEEADACDQAVCQ